MPRTLVKMKLKEGVANVKITNPPYNFLDPLVLKECREILESLDSNPDCRVIVLGSEGDVFCAGADFTDIIKELSQGLDPSQRLNEFYREVRAMFRCTTPIVAAVDGAAIGAGLGLALLADFRIACPEATFSANFNRLGFHPGFGLSITLPRLIGSHNAELLFYTGRRIKGPEAERLGLVTELVAREEVFQRAESLALEIARSAPIAVRNTRATMRLGLAAQVESANKRELKLQISEMKTKDFLEGISASLARRDPEFIGM